MHYQVTLDGRDKSKSPLYTVSVDDELRLVRVYRPVVDCFICETVAPGDTLADGDGLFSGSYEDFVKSYRGVPKFFLRDYEKEFLERHELGKKRGGG